MRQVCGRMLRFACGQKDAKQDPLHWIHVSLCGSEACKVPAKFGMAVRAAGGRLEKSDQDNHRDCT